MSGIKAVFFDMDDTLVMTTGEADAKAYREVLQLAKTRSEQVPYAFHTILPKQSQAKHCIKTLDVTYQKQHLVVPSLRWMPMRF